MTDHPDNLPRDINSYDPDEPLIVRYADVIAARNAVANLANIVRDKQTSLSEYSQGALRRTLPAGVDQQGIGKVAILGVSWGDTPVRV